MGKVYVRKVCSKKLGAFGLKISIFPCLFVVAIHVRDFVAFTMA